MTRGHIVACVCVCVHNSKGRFIHDVMCVCVCCLLVIPFAYHLHIFQCLYNSDIIPEYCGCPLLDCTKDTHRTFQNLCIHTQNDNNDEEDDDDDDYDVTLLETRSLCIVNGFSRSWNGGWWHRHIAGQARCGVRCEMDFICRGSFGIIDGFSFFFFQSSFI